MRTAIFLLLLTSLGIQSQWVQQPSGTSNILTGIHSSISSPSTAWICGAAGTILRTTNGGASWTVVFSGTQEYLTDIYFVNSSTGIAVGRNGVIVRTVNGGSQFTVNYVGSFDHYALSFINSSTGFVSSETGVVFKTTDAGANWSGVPITGLDNYGCFFLTASTGYVCGPLINTSTSSIKRTTNGGSNWIEINNGNGIYSSIDLADNQNGWCVGNSGRVVRANNSLSWISSFPLGTPNRLNDIYFGKVSELADGNTGWIAADSGKIYFTTNGGTNWTWQGTPVTENLFDVRVLFNTTGWAVGANGVILRTTNGGVAIGIQPISSEVPAAYRLSQNYPNPFNPQTNIEFSIPKTGFVNLTVYDILGREVSVLVNEQLAAGTYKADFDGSNLNSGVYFYTIRAGAYLETKKMIIIK